MDILTYLMLWAAMCSAWSVNGVSLRVPISPEAFNTGAYKGKQMTVSSTKSKTALQTGYFGKSFDRVMQGEAYSDPVKLRRQTKLREAQKNLSKAFIPSSGSKKPLVHTLKMPAMVTPPVGASLVNQCGCLL